MRAASIPKAFIWKRVHSLMGLWLVLFLLEHLVTNSQAALWLGDGGGTFVRMVNALHNLPYLQFIEITLLGIPIAIHMVFGIRYVLETKFNIAKGNGSTPSLPEYGRNRAYVLQRITSWILLIGIIGHVTKFRFLDYPETIGKGIDKVYLVKLQKDKDLSSVGSKLGVQLYDVKAVENAVNDSKQKSRMISGRKSLAQMKLEMQTSLELASGLQSFSIGPDQVIAKSSNFGAVTILSVRDTFQSPVYRILYTIFVLAACFHAFNGLWTFVVSWGIIIRLSAQRASLKYVIGLMGLIAFLGLAAVWGS